MYASVKPKMERRSATKRGHAAKAMAEEIIFGLAGLGGWNVGGGRGVLVVEEFDIYVVPNAFIFRRSNTSYLEASILGRDWVLDGRWFWC